MSPTVLESGVLRLSKELMLRKPGMLHVVSSITTTPTIGRDRAKTIGAAEMSTSGNQKLFLVRMCPMTVTHPFFPLHRSRLRLLLTVGQAGALAC